MSSSVPYLYMALRNTDHMPGPVRRLVLPGVLSRTNPRSFSMRVTLLVFTVA